MIAQSKKIAKTVESEMFFGSCKRDTKSSIAEQVCRMVEEYDIPESVALEMVSSIVAAVASEYGD